MPDRNASTCTQRAIPASFWPHANYWYDHCGIVFNEAGYANPDYMIQRSLQQQKHLYKKFGHLGVGDPEPEAKPIVNCFATTTMGAVLGCKVVFLENDEPYALPRNITDEELENFAIPTDFENIFPINVYLDEARYLYRKYGRAQISVNFQSVLNNALKFRGEQLMMDFYLKPEIARKVLDICFQTMENLRAFIRRKNREFGWPNDDHRVQSDNCTVQLISPETYRDFVLPFDKILAERYAANYGVHHCGQSMHKYAPYYSELRSARWYDIGFGSDVAECIRYYQDPKLEKEFVVRYGPVRLLNATADEVREEVRGLVNAGATSLLILGVDSKTPDENIEAYLKVAAGLA
ncbi:MAG: uroporphyrinogen decarboxylase family protein [Bacteroidota bacterium]